MQTSTKTPAPHLDAISTSTDKYDILLADFPAITTPNFVQQPTKHGVEHFITTKGPPVHVCAHRLPPDKLAAAKAEFCSMESMGIIRRSSSPWASPLHMVPKSSGGWRPVETTGASMKLLFQTDIQCLTCKISLLTSRV